MRSASRARLRVPALLVAAAVALPLAAAPAHAAEPAPVPGTLLPPVPDPTPAYVELQSAAPGYVTYIYGQRDEYGWQGITLYRLSDGAAVRNLPGQVGTENEPSLSATDVVQVTPADATAGPLVALTDIATGEAAGQVSVPVGDTLIGASAAGAVTTRTVGGVTALHVLRPDGTDTQVTGPAPGDYVGAVRARDERTVVYEYGTALWALDIASATTTQLTASTQAYVKVVLGADRIWWVTDAATGDLATWAGRDGQPGGQVTVEPDPRVQTYQAVGDTLLAEAYHDPVYHFDLRPVVEATGALGSPVAQDAVSVLPTGDGTLVMALVDGATVHLATLAPGQNGPAIVRTYAPRDAQAQRVALSGSRTAADFGDPYYTGGPVRTYTAAGGWQNGVDGTAAPGGLQQLAGDVGLTFDSNQPSTYQVTWPGGSRTISSGSVTLGHGGNLAFVDRGTSVDVEDTRTGTVRRSLPYDEVRWAADGNVLWTWPATSATVTGTDVTGSTPPVQATAPCPAIRGAGIFQVAGRWALMGCMDGTQWAVDLRGQVAPWPAPAADAPVLGNGFLAQVTRSADRSRTDLLVTDLAPGHAQRTYGPIHGQYSLPMPSIATDDAGGPRAAYLDGRRQVRLVDLDWLTPLDQLDSAAPHLTATGGSPRVAATSPITFTYAYTDASSGSAPASGIGSYDVRYRQRPAGATSYGALTYPAGWQGTTATTQTLAAARGTDTCLSVRARDVAGNLSGWSAERCSTVDGTAPAVKSAYAGPTVVSSVATSTVRFTVTATDNVAVASYDIAYRLATSGTALSGWTFRYGLPSGSATVRVAPGGQVCFAGRARDAAGNVSGWSAARCSAVPFDDRSLTAYGWVSRTGSSSALGGTVSTLRSYGAKVYRTRQQGTRVALVVLRGPGQGTVDVYAAGVRVGRVSLAAPSTHRDVVVLPYHAFRGTVTVRSVSRAPSRIDALAVLRT